MRVLTTILVGFALTLIVGVIFPKKVSVEVQAFMLGVVACQITTNDDDQE